MKSTGARSSNELQGLDSMTGYQDMVPGNGSRVTRPILAQVFYMSEGRHAQVFYMSEGRHNTSD